MTSPIIEYLLCSTCRLPFARIENGCLIIESRHHGSRHTNTISLDVLEEKVRRSHFEATEKKGFRSNDE
jgi:hypothetical protein